MSDLIDRQELIDNLNRFAPEHFHALINHLILKQPSAEKRGRWIPVTERLPEHNEDVLISYGPCVEAGWYNEIDGVWCTEVCSSLPVTAWMPLPEPWEEEKK